MALCGSLVSTQDTVHFDSYRMTINSCVRLEVSPRILSAVATIVPHEPAPSFLG
jgi:hypothetical protein